MGAPLIGAFFASTTPKGQDKKRAAKPKKNRTTRGEDSVTEPHQQHGELASAGEPKMPTDRQMTKEHARHAKRRATEDWISGHKTTKQHEAIHKRANHVLTAKPVRVFKGTTGEMAPKGRMKGPW